VGTKSSAELSVYPVCECGVVLVVRVVMPQFEETMQSGKIISWLKKQGEKVEKGNPIVQVETQKLTAEIEAPENGILAKILANEGDEIPVLQAIAVIAAPEELPNIDSFSRELLSEASSIGKVEEQRKPTGNVSDMLEKPVARIPISPLARKLAREHGIDPMKIKGSGLGGKITRRDVMREIAEGASAARLQPETERGKVILMSKMRKAIAERMSSSAKVAPQVTVTTEVDMSEAVRLRERLLPELETKTGVRLSYTDILVKVLAIALREHPILNSRLDGDLIRLIDEINIGVAVEVEEGLVVPVVHDADKKTLADVAKSTKQLVDGARAGKLSSSELAGGTFTISNLGSYGIDVFTPLINLPETAILGVGRIVEKPIAFKGQLRVKPMMCLSLSFDHRVIDGALAARFLLRIREILEAPSVLENQT
jgi:pyruvate dehydrogenase E2 component (dihydrolipoamide acetyltransferase)